MGLGGLGITHRRFGFLFQANPGVVCLFAHRLFALYLSCLVHFISVLVSLSTVVEGGDFGHLHCIA